MIRLSRIVAATAFFFAISGCQKDDICPEGTETTPLLVIDFTDVQDPSRLKAVEGLVVRATGIEEDYLGPTNTNSISIPLRTDQNFTEYSFVLNGGTDSENEDIVTFSYNPAPDYLNRACGYKIDFLNIEVNVHSDEDTWITSGIILQENVENETEAHISFTH
ncbi:DUF6452 family protein [Salinimicrobium flavum]|uniref:DUF6452 family protein n=1 Tax=Salinimicrobium flavum TaxID=1737065 RepID=A0ABW5J047_9FLAO